MRSSKPNNLAWCVWAVAVCAAWAADSTKPAANPLSHRGKLSGSAGKCGIFDAFKLAPEKANNFVGGSFALHQPDCSTLEPNAVQDIVAFQWVLAHWNDVQKKPQAKIGLHVGDSCQRGKEAVLQTLRFLDSVDYYDPRECAAEAPRGQLLAILLPRERALAAAVEGVLRAAPRLLLGAYSAESAEAVQDAHTLLVTSPMLEDYVVALTELMDQLSSDLLVMVTCQAEDPRVADITRLLVRNQVHISEVISVEHAYFAQVLNVTDSRVILYVPCQRAGDEPDLEFLETRAKTVITLGLDYDEVHFPFIVKGATEITIRQKRMDIPLFKDYFNDLLVAHHENYALAASFVQDLLNCSLVQKTCPQVTSDLLAQKFRQGPQVDAVVRLAYAFAVAGRFVESDEQLRRACSDPDENCAQEVARQLTSVKFVREERGPLELANDELGFFAKSANVVQSIGLKLQAIVAGGEEIFTLNIGPQSTVSQRSKTSALRLPRSVCQPHLPFCGQCAQHVDLEERSAFLLAQKVLPFQLAGLFNLHDANCEQIRQDGVVLALAYTHTLNTMPKHFPGLGLQPLREVGAFVVDACTDPYRVRSFTVDTETACVRTPVNQYNVTIPPGTVLAHVSALGDEGMQREHVALLTGLRVPAVSLGAEGAGGGVLALLPDAAHYGRAVAAFLRAQQWEFVTVIVSAGGARQHAQLAAFRRAAAERGICIHDVLHTAPHNRSSLPLQHHTNVTVFFTTAQDAADYVSTRLRFAYDAPTNVDVMVGEAQDFYLHDPVSAVQYTGTVAVRPKDVLPRDFVDFLREVTPLTLPEPWFWEFVERRWRCALSLHNRDAYEGRMCSGDELLNVVELGRMIDAGYLIRGVQTLLLGVNEAFRRVCGPTATAYCAEFMERSRELLRALLDAEKPNVEFEVDEFLPLDHHGNLGYRQIGNFTKTMEYTAVQDYKLYVSGILKKDVVYTSLCDAPLCTCKRHEVQGPMSTLEKVTGSIKWFHANNVNFFASFEPTVLNYVCLSVTAVLTLFTTIVLLLILYKVYTKVIKGNQSLGILSLLGIMSLNFTAFIYILDSKAVLAEVGETLNAVAHVLCFGVILLKAVCLRNAEDLSTTRVTQVGYWNYWMTLLFIGGVQVAISARHVTEEMFANLYSHGYILLLGVLALGANIRNRRIRRNYKESKWLLMASLVVFLLFCTWLVLSHVPLVEVGPRELRIVELNLMAATLLVLLFGPKVYILLFYEPLVVERSVTPVKDFFEDDLFEKDHNMLPDISMAVSMHSLPNAYSQTGTVSPKMEHEDEFPALKTVMRKKEFGSRRSDRDSSRSDRLSNVSTGSQQY